MCSHLSVLLVEDLKIAHLAVKSCITTLHWQLDIAETGQDAILRVKQARKVPYDVILMDLGLPDISGIEVARIIKQHHIVTPIIALSAHLDDDYKIAAHNVGMVGFIEKPFTLDKARSIDSLLSVNAVKCADVLGIRL